MKLKFVTQPKDVLVGAALDPIVVQVLADDGTVDVAASAEVELYLLEEVFKGNGKKLKASTPTNGECRFEDVQFDRVGQCLRLRAVAGSEFTDSESFSVQPAPESDAGKNVNYEQKLGDLYRVYSTLGATVQPEIETRRKLAMSLTVAVIAVCSGLAFGCLALMMRIVFLPKGDEKESFDRLVTLIGIVLSQTLYPLATIAIGWYFATRNAEQNSSSQK